MMSQLGCSLWTDMARMMLLLLLLSTAPTKLHAWSLPSSVPSPSPNTRISGNSSRRAFLPQVASPSSESSPPPSALVGGISSRRAFPPKVAATAAAAFVMVSTTLLTLPNVVHAAPPDCFEDCEKNCRLIAPRDALYCKETCLSYCAQSDRTDGLSGSISSSSGEVGILGGTFGQGTVVKGQDKPPSVSLPGLDFTGSSGRKLLGY